MLIHAKLTVADLEMVRQVLEGGLAFEPPYQGLTFEAASYIYFVRYNCSQAIAVQSVAIDMGLSDGCDVVVDRRGRRVKKRGI